MRTEGQTGTVLVAGHAANVFWSGLEAAVSAAFSFASAFIVARLVGPAEVGIGAAAVAVHVLLWVAVNVLFTAARILHHHGSIKNPCPAPISRIFRQQRTLPRRTSESSAVGRTGRENGRWGN
jgi:hypothetical protein